MKKRTEVDFKKHELHITEQEGLLVHHLKKPDTIVNNVKFINTNGVLVVTGDFGNWVFCREFHPDADNFVSDYYWLEKLTMKSSQKGEKFSVEETEKTIQCGIESELEERGYEGDKLIEAKEYYEELLEHVHSEFEYESFAYMSVPSFIDGEDVPHVTVIKPWLLVVFDAFDEICNRMKTQ